MGILSWVGGITMYSVIMGRPGSDAEEAELRKDYVRKGLKNHQE